MTEAADELSTGRWPLRLLTLADWEVLPEDDLHHVEVSEGVLVVVPRPSFDHQLALKRLVATLDRHLVDLIAVAEMDVVIEESLLTVRSPDIVVVDLANARRRPKRWHASEVRLAVEILSDGSRRMDRVTKASEYAEAGIEEYWLLELRQPTTLTQLRLGASGGYEQVQEHAGRVTVDLAGHPVSIDLDALTEL